MYHGFLFEKGWTERDLNPRPPPCEGGDLPLIYQPLLGKREKRKSI
jgi:hypothetical protein